jgi:hypothetical protein
VTSSSGIKELRPLALGELIDRSALFWRAHLVPLFALCFGFELVNYIFSKGVTLILERTNELFRLSSEQLEARAQSDLAGVLGDIGSLVLAVVALWIVLVWSYWLATLVISRYVVPVQLGEPVRPVDGLRRGLARLGAFTVAYFLSQLWGLVIGLLLMLPGIILLIVGVLMESRGANPRAVLAIIAGGGLLGLFGAVAAFLWYFLRFALLAPVFAMEDLSVLGTFRRSGALISGRVAPGFLGYVKVRAMILFSAVAGIIIAVSIIFSLPAWLVQAAYGHLTNPSAAASHPIPQALLVPVELFQVVGQSIFTPLALVFSAMFYLDMRMRREGLDLERRLSC